VSSLSSIALVFRVVDDDVAAAAAGAAVVVDVDVDGVEDEDVVGKLGLNIDDAAAPLINAAI
jgi:hypothetical protein